MTRTTRIVTLRRAERLRRQPPRPQRSRRLGAVLAVVTSSALVVVGLAAVVSVSALGVLSADLPDPSGLGQLAFAEPTIVYDREGKVELGRFQDQRRRVIAYADIPTLVLDATTTAEDRTFWDNAGVDPAALISAIAENASGTSERGASTITQQLVRARLLPEDIVNGSDRYLRKAKEIIQSLRLTDEYPGAVGKERVMTAYLNEIYYGHEAYGIAAAADVYFGVTDLAKLTPAQAALLAGLPKAPSSLDPYKFAKKDDQGRLVVPPSADPVIRRDWILQGLAAGAGRWTKLDPVAMQAALAEPVVLVGDRPARIPGGQFTWQVRRQLQSILGPETDLKRGGYRVITTLDWRAQRLAERWVGAAAIAPNISRKQAGKMLDGLKIPSGDRAWISALRGKDLHNGALVALDYRTGDVLAYVGSAGYARDDLASDEFEPKYDAAGDGARQPGSAWKPILYAAAFDAKRLTPGSVLLDVTTQFDRGQDWSPRDADQRERGPVLVRKALQYSLNIPAIRALERVGSKQVAKTAEALGVRFAGGTKAFMQAGLAGALGTVEVRPLDLTSAYGAIANGGVRVPPRMVLEIRSGDGRVIWKAPAVEGERAVSPQAAFMVTDILAGNTDPRQNDIWAAKLALRNGPGGSRRPAAAKTGTTNDARDLGTYGFLPTAPGRDGVGLVVGVWMGNSDHSFPSSRDPATSLTAAAPLWHAFVRDYTAKWKVTKFQRPKDVVSARIDAWSGGRPGGWTKDTTTEWFIRGTQPGGRKAIDKDGLLYRFACGGWRVDPVKAELGPSTWKFDVEDWLRRARRGPGVTGRYDSATAYFWHESSWGGQLFGSCSRPKPPENQQKDNGKDHKDKGGGATPGLIPVPTPAPTPPPQGG